MKTILKTLAIALLAINTCHAAALDGTQVSASGLAQGGSNVTFTWKTPKISKFKVWLQVPSDGTATNALYHVYPKGNSAGNSICSSSDATYPCIEIAVNQAANQGKWLQLKLGNNVKTAWSFGKSGFVSVNASHLASTEFLSASSVSFEEATPSLAIGQTYRGGIIFYLDTTKTHGLIAAPKDIVDSSGKPALVTWYNGSNTTTGATATAIGTGKANTTAIIASQGVGNYAAKLADDLVVGQYSDWYLPSKDELNLMYTTIGQGAPAPLTNIGGFASNYYWSSSEYNYYYSWYQYFYNSYQGNVVKPTSLLVRAVRAF